MTEKISIVCPHCRAKLSFMTVAGWQEKFVVCPHCHFKDKANAYQQYAPVQNSGAAINDSDTQLASGLYPSMSASQVGVIKVLETGRCHQLQMGTNIIGRVAKTGDADLKISTDPCMSRRHLRIDVVEGPLGIEHRLVEIGAKNNILLNGSPINRQDILVLSFGDILVLGQTKVSLEKPTNEDEEHTCLVNC